jgi:phytoene dehydrogenase-like protein
MNKHNNGDESSNAPLSDDSNTQVPDDMSFSAKELEILSDESALENYGPAAIENWRQLLEYVPDPEAKEKRERARKFLDSIRVSEEEARQIWKEHMEHEEGFRKFEQQLAIEGAQLRAQGRESLENAADQIQDKHIQDDASQS